MSEKCLRCGEWFDYEKWFQMLCLKCEQLGHDEAVAEKAAEEAATIEQNRIKAVLLKDYWTQPPEVQRYLKQVAEKGL